MALALYRKYRPRTFAEVIGQEHVTEPLSQALRTGRLHHAYLFSGPRGCGKTSSARILARSLNCEHGPTPDPCGQCDSCRSLANDGSGSIDVIEIDAASHGGVDDARELREKAFFAPAASRYKIYVIDEAHMVSSAGFNALLKLVEEPPDYVKFIFATTEPDKVLGTIRSRTHHYPFRLIPPSVLRPYLEQLCTAEGVTVDPAVFPLVVRAGGGSARDTLSVLDQLIAGAGPEGVGYARAVALLGVTDVTLIDEMCDALAAGDGAAAYATIDRVAQAGHDSRRFASDLLERLRDLIVIQQVPDAVTKGIIDGPADQIERMAGQATRLGPATLSRCADIVHNGLVEMRGTTAPRLLLELITARMLLPGAEESTGALLQRLERLERRLTLAGPDLDQGERAAPAPARDARAERPGPDQIGAAAGIPTVPGGGSANPANGSGGAPAAAPPSEAATAVDPVVRAGAAPSGADSAPTVPSQPAQRIPAPQRPPADAPADPPTMDDAPATAPVGLSAAALRDTWPEVVTMVGRRSKKIAALAHGATVREVDGGTVVLTFRFPAHARMLSSQPELVAEALYEVLGGRWQIRCEVAGEAAAPAAAAGRSAPTRSSPQPASPQPASPQPAQRPVQQDPRPSTRPPVPAAGARSAPAAARRPAEPVGDDDWPEPARPGGGSAVPARPAAEAPRSPGTGPWSDGTPAEEPPYDPEYDGPPRAGKPGYEGFDPGDEPLDDVVDEKTARQSSEQQAMRLLEDAFGAEKIGES